MSRFLTGTSAMTLAIAFNIPFALLAARFQYPDILRQPAADVLAAFHAGGPELIWIWYAFMLSAMALIPVSIAMAFSRVDWQQRPILAVGAAIAGSLAGLTQAIGLSRWVFAVPMLARMQAGGVGGPAGQAAREVVFDTLNLSSGVAVGEHIGQMLTILWIIFVALEQWRDGTMWSRLTALVGVGAIAGIGFGLGEGLAIGLGLPGDIYSLGTIIGYLAFSLWLMATGLRIAIGRSRS